MEQEESLVVTLINKSGADASQIRQLEIEREAVKQKKNAKQRLEPIEKQLVENPLAIDILEHKFQGCDVVLVDREDDHLAFTNKSALWWRPDEIDMSGAHFVPCTRRSDEL